MKLGQRSFYRALTRPQNTINRIASFYLTNAGEDINKRTLSTMTVGVGNTSSTSQPPLDIGGIYPPITTPFDLQGGVNLKALESNLQKWNHIKFRGYVVFGSNGEYKSLNETEKINIIKCVKKSSTDGRLIIVGTGCESSQATIDLTNKLADLGADLALVINPSYYKNQMDNNALLSYYTKVADESRIPLLLYNMPLFTGIDLDVELIVQLAKHPNIQGVKESTSNLAKISEMVLRTNGHNFEVMAGSADYLLPSLLMGAVGGICASANVIGEDIVRLFQLFENHQMTEAVQLQRKLLMPNKAVTRMFGVSGLKLAMDWLGYEGGICRSPLLPLDPAKTSVLKNIFVQHEYLKP